MLLPKLLNNKLKCINFHLTSSLKIPFNKLCGHFYFNDTFGLSTYNRIDIFTIHQLPLIQEQQQIGHFF